MFPVETISAKMLDYYVRRFDTVIIDLRNEKEYAAGHVRTAYNIPYEVFAEEPGMLEKNCLQQQTRYLYSIVKEEAPVSGGTDGGCQGISNQKV